MRTKAMQIAMRSRWNWEREKFCYSPSIYILLFTSEGVGGGGSNIKRAAVLVVRFKDLKAGLVPLVYYSISLSGCLALRHPQRELLWYLMGYYAKTYYGRVFHDQQIFTFSSFAQVPLKGEASFKPHPQNRIFVHPRLRGSFQNFRRAPASLT